MKTILITLALVFSGNALADAPYKHEYLNEGHFEAAEQVAYTPYRHEYENGGYFAVAEQVKPALEAPRTVSTPGERQVALSLRAR